MIINFSVENFLSINEKITLSFEPVKYRDEKSLENSYIYKSKSGIEILKLAIIYGANASGKTNILKALGFLRDFIINPPIFRLIEGTKVIPFKFTEEGKNSKFEIEFLFEDKKYYYYLELDKKRVILEKLYSFNPKKSLVFSRFLENDKIKIKFGSKVKLSKLEKDKILLETLDNRSILTSFLEVNIKIPEVENTIKWFLNNLKPIIFPHSDLKSWATEQYYKGKVNKDIVLQILKKADFNITYIKINREEKELDDKDKEILELVNKLLIKEGENVDLIKKTKILEEKFLFGHNINGKIYYLDYEDESAGTQRFFQFAVLLDLMMKNSLIIPIDEIEASLHPDLVEFFLKMFLANTTNSQLILTTHYRELLQNKDWLRRDVIWFTEKKVEDNSTDLFSLTDFKSDVIRNTTSIYNAYKKGILGAVPYFDSYKLR
jgi:AAA15 family ATPase/GTPase